MVDFKKVHHLFYPSNNSIQEMEIYKFDPDKVFFTSDMYIGN